MNRNDLVVSYRYNHYSGFTGKLFTALTLYRFMQMGNDSISINCFVSALNNFTIIIIVYKEHRFSWWRDSTQTDQILGFSDVAMFWDFDDTSVDDIILLNLLSISSLK